MTKERVIYVLVLCCVFAGCFAVYQFYFKAKLEKYAQDKQLLANLNDRYTALSETFRDEDPDTVIAQYRSVVESWRDAIAVRVPYFNDAAWREHESPPDDVFILQFWYGEQTGKMLTALWEKAQAQYGAQVYQRFPLDVQPMLGVATADQWQGYDISRELVTEQLERLSYGISILEYLMSHDAQQIRQVSLYPPKPSGFVGKDVEYSEAGLSFVIQMKDLVKLLEDMRTADEYFSIEGMKVAHQFVGVKYEPRLEVEMLLARAKPKRDLAASLTTKPNDITIASTAGETPAAAQDVSVEQAFDTMRRSEGDTFNAMHRHSRRRALAPPPGPVGKFWKWFKRTVLYTN